MSPLLILNGQCFCVTNSCEYWYYNHLKGKMTTFRWFKLVNSEQANYLCRISFYDPELTKEKNIELSSRNRESVWREIVFEIRKVLSLGIVLRIWKGAKTNSFEFSSYSIKFPWTSLEAHVLLFEPHAWRITCSYHLLLFEAFYWVSSIWQAEILFDSLLFYLALIDNAENTIPTQKFT